jgi:3D-(3,5/4)-trihydroxycyclohexane-1,2-dione acylhydrolase (decyclizing)
MAQAVVKFLVQQRSARDGREQSLFGGVFGIFGHGNVAGIGQALQEQRGALPFYLPRNEQAMVHTAAAYAKMHNRLRTLACTSSIGPGATNMITGAAGATINRVPVLLLPGDIFANRRPSPVLQQLESSQSQDVSVNDCFKPVSRYWDRINRPEQIVTSLPEAMRVLTSPAETGAVTLALPQDVQAEAYDYPAAFFEPRVWTIPRARADRDRLHEAARLIRASTRPMIVAGGGVIYSEATDSLRRFVDATGIAVGETQAGKGALPDPHPLALGGVGATGTHAANVLARDADLVVVIGSRLSDFTTASKTAFQNEQVRFIAVNVAEVDAFKHAALPLVADARAALEELLPLVAGYHVEAEYTNAIAGLQAAWRAEVDRLYAGSGANPQSAHSQPAISNPQSEVLRQAQVIGVLQKSLAPTDVIVCAAGSLPGDLHKLWRARDPKGYHMEYGYSCMGYEIAGGLGVKMAAPDREVYVLSQSVGSAGFGTRYRYRDAKTGELDGELLPVDLAANAASLGAHVIRADTLTAFHDALVESKAGARTSVIVVAVDRESRVGGYESWWDVPVAEVSTSREVQDARAAYEEAKRREREFL